MTRTEASVWPLETCSLSCLFPIGQSNDTSEVLCSTDPFYLLTSFKTEGCNVVKSTISSSIFTNLLSISQSLQNPFMSMSTQVHLIVVLSTSNLHVASSETCY